MFVRLELTSLFVTHDHDEAFALADRLVVMHDGRIEQSGSPAEVWHRPANEFVARFLGWNVTRAFGDGTVAVRPGALRVVDGPGVTGVVTARTFRREHFLLDVRVDVSDPPEILQVEVPLSAHAIPDVGARVTLGPEPGATVALD